MHRKIFYLATRDHLYTANALRERLPHSGSLFQPMSYHELFSAIAPEAAWEVTDQSWWPTSPVPEDTTLALGQGAYIFSDIERLGRRVTKRASVTWNLLHTARLGPILNHPARSMRRYELLRSLYEGGVNDFNVYRLTESRQPSRFPVFIRDENDHKANRFPLIHDQYELDQALALIHRSGRPKEDVIVVEYTDVSDENGVFNRYSAYRIGSRIIPRTVHYSNEWVVKSWTQIERTPWMLEREREHVMGNSHGAQVMEIFEFAGIDYGRIDYAVTTRGLCIFEINTNPYLRPVQEKVDEEDPRRPLRVATTKGLADAFAEIAESG